MENKVKRLEFLDALRGIAALLVFFYHLKICVYTSELSKHSSLWTDIGYTGVFLFFIISSYSLSMTMPRHQNSNRPLISFYFHRIFRILPLYWSIFLVCFLKNIIVGHKIIWWDFLINALCVFNFYVPYPDGSYVMAGWTISVEMIFYSFFPFIYFYAKTVNRLLLLLFLSIILYFIVRYFVRFVLFPYYTEYMYFSIIHFIPFFICGMLVYLLSNSSKIPKQNQYLFGLITNIIAIILIVCYTYKMLPIAGGHFIWSSDRDIILILGYLLLLFGLKYCPLKVFVNKATIFLGKISFSVYLTHTFFIMLLKQPITDSLLEFNFSPDLNFFILFVAIFSPTVYFSHISYKIIEKTGIEYGKRFLRDNLHVTYAASAA
jgi:peptidoglycan/LPS O-acetylase OafA/YrhL